MSAAARGPVEITVEALHALREGQAPHTVLDVRQPEELELCALPGALHIPMGDVPARLEELRALDPSVPLVVLCHHGVRSLRVALYLQHEGLGHACSLRGGIDLWSTLIDPKVPRY